MVRPKHPCVQTCPDRTATCHGQCDRYSVYEAKMKAYYAEREEMARGRRPTDQIKKMIDRQARQGKRGFCSTWKGE